MAAGAIAFAGKATLWVSEKIAKATVERGNRTWVDKLIEDRFDAISAALVDNKERLDRNFRLIQDIRGSQYASQYTEAFDKGSGRIKAIWDSFQLKFNSSRGLSRNEALTEAMTGSPPISVLLKEFQNALLPAQLGSDPLRAPFNFFSIAYSSTTSHLNFGPRDFMEGLYAVTDAISCVQAIALIMLELSEPSEYNAIKALTEASLQQQKDEVFRDVLWKRAEDNSDTLKDILQKTGDAEAKVAFEEYCSNLESKIPLKTAFYFRGVEQADRYLCCYYPSTAAFGHIYATREAFVTPLSWAQVKQIVVYGNSINDLPAHRTVTPTWESVRWELWPTEDKRPGFYHLNCVPRNTYVRHEPESKGAYEGKRNRPTVLGRGNLMTFKLILSSDAKLEDGIIKGQLIETEQTRWGGELPGWCGDSPITWSMAAAGSQQAKDDGWV